MRISLYTKWADGFLDYYRGPYEYRVQVIAWKQLEKLEKVYFVHPKSLRLLWNYILEIGLKEVYRKVRSRINEKYRNEKFVSCGLARIIESGSELLFPIGRIVAFIAPCHPKCVERLVLPAELMSPMDQEKICDFKLPSDFIYFRSLEDDKKLREQWWAPVRGWSSYSGMRLASDVWLDIHERVKETIYQTDWAKAVQLNTDANCVVSETQRGKLPARSTKVKSAVLFGYGNHAKTIILPNIRRYLHVDCIHEVDPAQIPRDTNTDNRWDTSPTRRVEEDYDVWLIAGFHHTHAPLAIQALGGRRDAIVEKPIVTTQDQLAELLCIMEKSKSRLFACFHKRYLAFNDLAIRDLGLEKGGPISYHCIVYEVPVPKLHWYRWPNSKSRLVSNGCHWVDHFLFLNNFCAARSLDLTASANGTINCSILLENDAFFTMVLTEKGSDRIGVQDYIELRSNRVTVRMTNGSEYIAENGDRIIRKKKVNKMLSYKTMYRSIGERIVNGTEGDSLRSVRVSCGLMLALENKLGQLLKHTGHRLEPFHFSQ